MLDSIVIATPEQVSVDLGGESVILNVTSGTYYGLNGTGARIWSLAQKPISVTNICETLVQEYDVEFDTCAQAVQVLLTQLVEYGLIEIFHETVA